MYVIILLFLVFVTGSNSNSICNNMLECRKLPLPDSIPMNKEELDKYCSELITYGNCYVNALECKEEESGEKTHVILRRNLNYMERACVPGNEIYQVIVNNLECLKSSVGNVRLACDMLQISEPRKAVFEQYKQRFITRINTDYRFKMCLKGIWKATCSAITAGEMCGEESGNAVLNIQTNTDYSVTMFCSEAEISLIPEFMQAYMQAESGDASVVNESVE